MKIFLLVAISTVMTEQGPMSDIDFAGFKTKERCELNIPNVKKQLKPKYDKVEVHCIPVDVKE